MFRVVEWGMENVVLIMHLFSFGCIGTLQPRESLGFYFEAAEKALSDIKEQYPDRKVHVVSKLGVIRIAIKQISSSACRPMYCGGTRASGRHLASITATRRA